MGFFDIFKKKKSKKGEIQFHIGKCPFCDEQGWLKLARDDNDKVYIVCDESYHEFDSIEDVKNKNPRKSPLLMKDEFLSLEETIKEGYQDYIYIFNNNAWQKLKK